MIAVLFVVSASVGFVATVRKDAHALAQNPAPGSFADAGGHRLHYRVIGAGDVTFVLDAGLGEYSGSWSGLDTLLATFGRVFVYDRAGYGWSEAGPSPRTVQRLAAELNTLLESSGVPGPYILVGHSMGGAVMTFYATAYPTDVAGLFLIDPSHRDQVARLPAPPFLEQAIATQLPRTARVGLAGLLFGSSDPIRNRAKHIATFGAELRAVDRSVELWDGAPIDLGMVPVYVLTAGTWDAWPGDTETEQRAVWQIWREMHAELVASSSSGIRRHIVVDGAGHYIHEDAPAAVVAAARELHDRITARPESGSQPPR